LPSSCNPAAALPIAIIVIIKSERCKIKMAKLLLTVLTIQTQATIF
jgi:hypothetical protein